MDPAIGRVRFDAAKAAWLWTMITTGLIGVLVATPTTLAIAGALHVVTLCVGHSVGLHRGIIHRTYRARPAVLGVLAYLAVLTGLGGPLTWARLHAVRDHWQNQPACPAYFGYRHSLARDFLWYLPCRFEPTDRRAEQRLPPDLLSDRSRSRAHGTSLVRIRPRLRRDPPARRAPPRRPRCEAALNPGDAPGSELVTPGARGAPRGRRASAP